MSQTPHKSNQDDLIKFVNDPKTIARAIEGSMEKRIAMTDTLQTAELDKSRNDIALRLYRLKYEQLNDFSQEFVDDVHALVRKEAYRLASEAIGEDYTPRPSPEVGILMNYLSHDEYVANQVKAEQRQRLQSLIQEDADGKQ